MHRRKILFEREKSLLPAMQIFVEAYKNIQISQKEYDEIAPIYTEQSSKVNHMMSTTYRMKIESGVLDAKIKNVETPEEEKPALLNSYKAALKKLKNHKHEIAKYRLEHFNATIQKYRNVNEAIWRWRQVYETGEEPGGEKKERREFMMRCSAEDCRGFLSTAYKCGVCDKKTCSECLEVLGEGEHTCKPEAVETATAIKKETRACPKCGVRIFKIDGCDQMWCTVSGCGTAFSWNTGAIVSGRVHNPHYYEWLRRTGGGAAPREVGDIPCGGLPDAWALTNSLNMNNYVENTVRLIVYEIHRNLLEFQDRLRHYPNQPPALYNKEINVRYLMNATTETEWMTALEHAEAKFNRKKEIGQILQTLVIAAADIMRDMYNQSIVPDNITFGSWLEGDVLPSLESLRAYTNESFKKLSESTRMAVPQIGPKWQWTPNRAIYKKKNEIIETV